jgi:excisionase family DNA binding protein
VPSSPLFVRLPTAEAEKLDRAAFALRTAKGRLVASLVARYVDPSTPEGLEALRALPVDEDRPLVGRYAFRQAEHAEVLTLAETAQLLRVSEDAVRELASQGDLPGRKVGRRWRFSRQAVIEWLATPHGRGRPGF